MRVRDSQVLLSLAGGAGFNRLCLAARLIFSRRCRSFSMIILTFSSGICLKCIFRLRIRRQLLHFPEEANRS